MEKIVDPAAILSAAQINRFEIKMYSNLSVPSYIHGYSLGIEYAKNWFLEKFNPNFFPPGSVHVNEKIALDDYRKLSKAAILKKDKPILIITPQLSFDFDLDNVHMYNYGADLLTMSGWRSDAFFRDSNKDLYLNMNMQLMEIRFTFKVLLYTRAQQMDLYKRMEILFRIGGTQGEDRDLDFHIPTDIMINLAHDAGFEVDPENKVVKDPIAFVRYLNMHSAFPILYKLRYITGSNEYFMRVPSLYIHTNCMDKLSPDDGEMNGQLRTDYGIEMQTVVRLPVPQFYVYHTRVPIEYDFVKQETDPNNIMYNINTFKVVDIPLHNEKGWEKYVWTEYAPDEEDGNKINMSDIFGDSQFSHVINITKSNNISPNMYMDLQVFSNDPTKDGKILTHMDWGTNDLIFDEPVALNGMLYISIYVDLNYYNSVITDIDDIDKNRINKTHTDMNNK